MGEPISLALVGGVVLTEGVKFLFEQASSLVRAARARRAEAKEAAGLRTLLEALYGQRLALS